MADLHGEIRSLSDLADEVARVGILLRGTQTQPGLIQQLHEATIAGEAVADRLEIAPELSAKVDGLKDQFQQLPGRLLAQADSLAFRAAVSRILTEEAGNSIEKIQDISLDRLGDEITHRMDRLSDDVFTRKIAPAINDANAFARLKADREDYKNRAETAEKLLAGIEVISKKTEADLIAQIERIRVSATQPNRWALFSLFALGWGSALFAGAGWDVVTTSVLGHTIPFPLPWR